MSTPLARRRRERGDNRDRRRDHEGAGTRDDEQDERAVDPYVPAGAEHQRRDDRDCRGQRDDRRRVDAGEALDERLRRRALRLRASRRGE